MKYRIDHRDEIVFVSDSWERFAAANCGAPALAGGVVGHLALELRRRDHYATALQGPRRAGTDRRTATFAYRCDAPERRRFMHMTMTQVAAARIGFAPGVIAQVMRRHDPERADRRQRARFRAAERARAFARVVHHLSLASAWQVQAAHEDVARVSVARIVAP